MQNKIKYSNEEITKQQEHARQSENERQIKEITIKALHMQAWYTHKYCKITGKSSANLHCY